MATTLDPKMQDVANMMNKFNFDMAVQALLMKKKTEPAKMAKQQAQQA